MNTNPSPPSGNRPPDALMGLLSDPEALRRMASVLGAVLSAPPQEGNESLRAAQADAPSARQEEQSEKPPTDAPASASPMPPTGAMDGLSAILSNPAMLEQLPRILSVMKPMLTAAPTPKPSAPAPTRPEDCRNNLLQALKPFLSPARCDAIDSIIRISHLGNVFSQLK